MNSTPSQDLLARANQYQSILSRLPWVRAILVTGSVASNSASRGSDIDLVVLSDPNRVYLTKGWFMFVFSLLRLRENHQNKSGRFSLGTIISIDFSAWQIKLSPSLEYTKINLARMVPIYGRSDWEQVLSTDPVSDQFTVDSGHKNPINLKYRQVWRQTGARILDGIDYLGYRLHHYKTFAQTKNISVRSYTIVERDLLSLHAVSRVLDKTDIE